MTTTTAQSGATTYTSEGTLAVLRAAEAAGWIVTLAPGVGVDVLRQRDTDGLDDHLSLMAVPMHSDSTLPIGRGCDLFVTEHSLLEDDDADQRTGRAWMVMWGPSATHHLPEIVSADAVDHPAPDALVRLARALADFA